MVRSALPWLLILVAAAAAGCSGPEESASPAEPASYTVRGMFARAEDDGVTMTVRHEEIPGYMASMTMPFKVADPGLLDELAYGDKIEFTLQVDDEGARVTSIAKLPDDTVLDFETP